MNGWMNEAKADYSAAQSIQRAQLSRLESANQEKALFSLPGESKTYTQNGKKCGAFATWTKTK